MEKTAHLVNGKTSQPPSKLYEEFFGSQDWARIMLEKVPETRVACYMLLPASQVKILTPQQLALRNTLPLYWSRESYNKRNAPLTIFTRYRELDRTLNPLRYDGRICYGAKNFGGTNSNGFYVGPCGNIKPFLERFCSECDIKFHMNVARRRAERQKVVLERDKAVLRRFRQIQ